MPFSPPPPPPLKCVYLYLSVFHSILLSSVHFRNFHRRQLKAETFNYSRIISDSDAPTPSSAILSLAAAAAAAAAI